MARYVMPLSSHQNPRGLTKGGENLLSKYSMVPIKCFPTSPLIGLCFKTIEDPDERISSSPSHLTIPKPMGKGLTNIPCAHLIFIIHINDKSHSPRVNRHNLVPNCPNKCAFFLASHSIPYICPLTLRLGGRSLCHLSRIVLGGGFLSGGCPCQ